MRLIAFLLSGTVLVAALIATPSAYAQNTSGVFSPTVDDGESSLQYRGGYDPDTDAHAHRLHYQRAISDDLRWRILAQGRKRNDQDFDFDYARAELMWQLNEDGAAWRHALRFELRVRDEDRPGDVTVHWTNHVKVTDHFSYRIIGGVSAEFGANTDDGLLLQTRARANWKTDAGPSVGVEMFNQYGSTADFADFEDQRHQIGPYTSFDIADNWSVFTGALFGVTDVASDTELRFWLERAL
ncbi:MAG: hypothetical protein AAGC95_15040 [Pseudomonadota bacterium]